MDWFRVPGLGSFLDFDACLPLESAYSWRISCSPIKRAFLHFFQTKSPPAFCTHTNEWFSFPGAPPKLLHFSFIHISTLTLLHVSHAFYQALSDSRFFQIQILSDSDSIKFYQIQTPSSSIKFYQILSDFIRHYQILSDSESTRFSFYQVLSDPIRFYQIQILASSDFIRFYQALSDSIRLYQTLSD